LAAGERSCTLGDTIQVGQHGALKALHAGVDAIVAELYQELVRWPKDENERQRIREEFYTMEYMPAVTGE
jgi:hypothetical protein